MYYSSAYVDASRKFALIGNFWDTVDRGRKRAYVVEVELVRLSATGYFCRQLVVCSCKHAYADLEL